MRLIDADRLKEYINDCEYCDKCKEETPGCTRYCELPDGLTAQWERIINEQPTVKQQETAVVHSHWNENKNYMWEKTGYWECDSCKGLSMKYSNFCPHCGAKMDVTTRNRGRI